MTRFLFFFLASLLLLPTESLAAEISDCDAGSLECICTPSDPVPYEGEEFSDVDTCVSYCEGVAGSSAAEVASSDPITGYSVQCAVDGQRTTISQEALEGEETVASEVADYNPPLLGIEIPGLTLPAVSETGGVITSNYLGLYIEAVYNFLIPVAGLLAVLMLMIGGLQWMLARGDSGRVGKAKDRIKNAVTGLVLLLGAYTMAAFVDPSTVYYDPLSLRGIDPEKYVEDSLDLPGTLQIAPGTGEVPDAIKCDSSYELSEIAQSTVGYVSYRYGGKGGPPPYPSDTKDCELGPCSEYCPEGTVCFDCSGYVNFLASCAGLSSANESGGTSGIFGSSSAEKITSCTNTTVNGSRELIAGDLIGWGGGHVFIYVGNGTIYDSHGSGRAAGQAIGVYETTWACDNYMNTEHGMYVVSR